MRDAGGLEENASRIPHPASRSILVEDFISGPEVALEGLVVGGRLWVLALFDKPDPLDGPSSEETIYTTPSRLPEQAQAALGACARDAVTALGLREGPVHGELRWNERGPWLIERAASSRSEEHTSELQSLAYLVCRLLLEKKKQQG